MPVLPNDPIGVGRTAEVYEWGTDRVLKLLRPGMPCGWIELEAEKTRAVRATGAPAPSVHEQLEIDGRCGVVFGRVGSVSMLGRLLASPWKVWRSGHELGDIHADVLQRRSLDLPNVKDLLAEKINRAGTLPRDQANRARDALLFLPDGDSVLHGDFHPDNVFATPSGPVLIDWSEAARGAMAADVVRTLWLLSAPVIPPDLPRRPLAVGLVGLLRTSYLRRIAALTQITERDLQDWWLPVVAGRLSEGIEHEEAHLLEKVNQLTRG